MPLYAIFESPEDAFHLTQLRVICGQHFRRSMDIRHLQHYRGEHYRLSDTYHQLLIEVFQNKGCKCNPHKPDQLRHQCNASRKLSMLHLMIILNPDNRWIAFPVKLADDQMAPILGCNLLLHCDAPELLMHPLRQELHQVWTTTCRAVCTGNEYPAVFRYIVQCLVRHRPEQTCLTCEQPGTVTHYQNDEPWQLLKHQCPIVLNIGLRLPADFCTDRVDQDAVTPHDRHRLSQLESSFSAMLKTTRGETPQDEPIRKRQKQCRGREQDTRTPRTRTSSRTPSIGLPTHYKSSPDSRRLQLERAQRGWRPGGSQPRVKFKRAQGPVRALGSRPSVSHPNAKFRRGKSHSNVADLFCEPCEGKKIGAGMDHGPFQCSKMPVWESEPLRAKAERLTALRGVYPR